jgi:hypothetical protein
MSDHNRPHIVYTIPYSDYLLAQGFKRVFMFLVGVTIVTNVFLWTLYLVTLAVPAPILNQMMGKTPEQVKAEAQNRATSDRRERWEKQEKIHQETIAKERQKAYAAEAARKSQLELDKMLHNPVVSEETARLRAFH